MRNRVSTVVFWIVSATAAHVANGDWWTNETSPEVRFDIRPVAAAVSEDDSPTVRIDILISAMVPTIEQRLLDQWTIEIVPRNEQTQIVDYEPRTQLASELAGPIDVKSVDEKTKSFGLNAAGSYGPGHADAGLDQGQKSTRSTNFQKLPPMKAVTASGTIHRGRGVYFKLRAATQQVLEGEKRFMMVLQVPEQWRGDLLNVRISGQKMVRPFGSFSDEIQTVTEAQFVVATFRDGDDEAAQWAHNLVGAEDNLREAARKHQQHRDKDSLTKMLHRFAGRPLPSTTSLAARRKGSEWLERLVVGKANPYTDSTIQKLPVDLRVVAIDYCDQVMRLQKLNTAGSVTKGRRQYVSAKPSIINERISNELVTQDAKKN